MHLIFHLIEKNNKKNIEKNKRVKLELNSKQKIKDIKRLVVNEFNLHSILLTNTFNLYLKFHGTELKDEWNIQHIPPGSTIKCIVDVIKTTDYFVYVLFQKRILELTNTNFDPKKTLVIELRVYLSNMLGIPLSVFRLKSSSNSVMYDQHLISDYKLTRNSQFILETWNGWDLFLEYCIKGFTKQIIELFSKDELIRQYQIKVALYIGSYYDNYDLVNKMMRLGGKPDEPVGMHPCRMWCQSNTISDKIALHIAAQYAHFKLILLMIKYRVHILNKKDYRGLPLWRIVLHYCNSDLEEVKKRKEIARFLLMKQASLKFELSKEVKISLTTYSKIKYWIESAQERVYKIYGFRYTSLKTRPFYKSSLLGPRVLVDGYNNDFTEFRNKFNTNTINRTKFDKLPQIKRTNSITNMTHSSYISFHDTTTNMLDSNRTDYKHTPFNFKSTLHSFDEKNSIDLKEETLKLFAKHNYGLTINESARYYLDKVEQFKTKSWLQKIELGSKMAQSNVKQRLRNSTL